MTYRLAKSLEVLRDEVNAAAPNRSKASDGWIGDAAHAARTSDHNPFIKDHRGTGVVRAYDFTHDPKNGCDAGRLAEHVRIRGRRGDLRVRYVIWNRQIASALQEWRWRPYSGSNPHTQHVHVSVSEIRAYYDYTKPWGWQTEEPDVTEADHKQIAQAVEKAAKDAVKPLTRRLSKLEAQAAAAAQEAQGMAIRDEMDTVRRALRLVLEKQGVSAADIKKLGV